MKRLFNISLKSFAALLIVYLGVVGGFYIAGYRLYRIPTAAMQPTILKGERAIGRLSGAYRSHLKRFDLAIFNSPVSPGEIYVKRVIGLPGEHVTVVDGGVLIDGRNLELPPAVDRYGLGKKKCDFVLSTDSVFLLGDYASNSYDSRYFGPVSISELVGRMVFKK